MLVGSGGHLLWSGVWHPAASDLPDRGTVVLAHGFGEYLGRYGHIIRALTENPALVVVQGGLNDYDVPDEELRSGVRDVLAQLVGSRAVLVGPPEAPSRAAYVTRVDALLAAEARRAGVPYVRTADWELPFLPDRLHLTADGHRAFGDAVAARIAEITDGLDGLADGLG